MERIEKFTKDDYISEIDSMEETLQDLYEEEDYQKVLNSFGYSWEQVRRNLENIGKMARDNKKEKELQKILDKYKDAFDFWNKTNRRVQEKNSKSEKIEESDIPDGELEKSLHRYKLLCKELRSAAELILEKAPDKEVPPKDEVQKTREGFFGRMGSLLGWKKRG